MDLCQSFKFHLIYVIYYFSQWNEKYNRQFSSWIWFLCGQSSHALHLYNKKQVGTYIYSCNLFIFSKNRFIHAWLCTPNVSPHKSEIQGRIQDAKLVVRTSIFLGGISCEKSRFYAKKSYFFQLRREARKFVGYFVWKITI